MFRQEENLHTSTQGGGDSCHEVTSVQEYVFYVFKHDLLRFFEMTYQKVLKSHQQHTV